MARIVFDSSVRPRVKRAILKAMSAALAADDLATVYTVAVQGGRPTAHFARIAGDILAKREDRAEGVKLLRGLLGFHRKEVKRK